MTKKTERMKYDESYKTIFSHRDVVKELLQGFVQENWVKEIDFESLEKYNGSYVGDDLVKRADDIIWRVKVKTQWIYLYVLIEFQSRNDPWMAVRLMAYIGLLYQDLIKSGMVSTEERLPPVFPIVVYNGETRWVSEQTLSRLIEPYGNGLESYQPELRYAVLDEGRVPDDILSRSNSTLSEIIRLEQSPEPADVREIVSRLKERLQDKRHDSLRRALTVWLSRVVIRKLIPEEPIPELNDLQEIDNMLAERVEQWTMKWKSSGRQEGMQEGMQKGMQKGESRLLLRQIQKRFGDAPGWAKAKIEKASEAQLQHWAENILDATTLEDIFQD